MTHRSVGWSNFRIFNLEKKRGLGPVAQERSNDEEQVKNTALDHLLTCIEEKSSSRAPVGTA